MSVRFFGATSDLAIKYILSQIDFNNFEKVQKIKQVLTLKKTVGNFTNIPVLSWELLLNHPNSVLGYLNLFAVREHTEIVSFFKNNDRFKKMLSDMDESAKEKMIDDLCLNLDKDGKAFIPVMTSEFFNLISQFPTHGKLIAKIQEKKLAIKMPSWTNKSLIRQVMLDTFVLLEQSPSVLPEKIEGLLKQCAKLKNPPISTLAGIIINFYGRDKNFVQGSSALKNLKSGECPELAYFEATILKQGIGIRTNFHAALDAYIKAYEINQTCIKSKETRDIYYFDYFKKVILARLIECKHSDEIEASAKAKLAYLLASENINKEENFNDAVRAKHGLAFLDLANDALTQRIPTPYDCVAQYYFEAFTTSQIPQVEKGINGLLKCLPNLQRNGNEMPYLALHAFRKISRNYYDVKIKKDKDIQAYNQFLYYIVTTYNFLPAQFLINAQDITEYLRNLLTIAFKLSLPEKEAERKIFSDEIRDLYQNGILVINGSIFFALQEEDPSKNNEFNNLDLISNEDFIRSYFKGLYGLVGLPLKVRERVHTLNEYFEEKVRILKEGAAKNEVSKPTGNKSTQKTASLYPFVESLHDPEQFSPVSTFNTSDSTDQIQRTLAQIQQKLQIQDKKIQEQSLKINSLEQKLDQRDVEIKNKDEKIAEQNLKIDALSQKLDQANRLFSAQRRVRKMTHNFFPEQPEQEEQTKKGVKCYRTDKK